MHSHCSHITKLEKKKTALHTLEKLSQFFPLLIQFICPPHMSSINYPLCFAKYLLILFSSISLALFKSLTPYCIFLAKILLILAYIFGSNQKESNFSLAIFQSLQFRKQFQSLGQSTIPPPNELWVHPQVSTKYHTIGSFRVCKSCMCSMEQ